MVSLNPFSRSEDNAGDERIAKRADNGIARQDRLSSDRPMTENRENTDSVRRDERRAMLRATDTLLPTPPEMPGYHLCWLTTTNTKDTVEARQRLGYELVKRAELPDFVLNSQKSGEITDDRIMVNEMVLAKIARPDWEHDMMYAHHERPTELANGLKDQVNIMKDGRGNNVAYTGGDFSNGMADGFRSLGRDARPQLKGVQ